MAQLKEDEWPRDGEPTTDERQHEPGSTPERDERPGEGRGATPTVPVSNTEPDQATD